MAVAPPRSGAGRPSHVRVLAKMAVAPPCMMAVPKPRTIQVPSCMSGRILQVVHVLENCEAGTDSKAENRGVDEKADAVVPQQHDDDCRLECLLDEWRYVAGVVNELEPEPLEAGHVNADSSARQHRNLMRS